MPYLDSCVETFLENLISKSLLTTFCELSLHHSSTSIPFIGSWIVFCPRAIILRLPYHNSYFYSLPLIVWLHVRVFLNNLLIIFHVKSCLPELTSYFELEVLFGYFVVSDHDYVCLEPLLIILCGQVLVMLWCPPLWYCNFKHAEAIMYIHSMCSSHSLHCVCR